MKISNIFISIFCAGISCLIVACNNTKEDTLSQVSNKTLSYEPVKIKTPSREDAINNYRSFLKNAENKAHFGDALRRLADLELENAESKSSLGDKESTIEGQNYMLSSIQHYKTYLDTYPEQKNNDLILYQLAKAYSLIGDEENALNTMNTIIHSHPDTKYIDEVQFRRGEILFVFGDFREAELAYQYIVNNKIDSIYYEKSLYKLGWSQFKQSKYQIALVNFFNILDRKQEQRKILADGLSPNLSQSEKDFLNDCLRVISFTFSYNDGTNSIQQLFSTRSNRVYKPLLYKQLGQLYLKKDRIPDAAEVFLSFSNDNRHDQLAPDFHVLAIDAYKQGNFHDKVLKLKKQFVEHYGVGSKFWLAQTGGNRYKLNIQLKSNIRELAYHYHALARKSKKPQDFNLAAHWYQVFLRSFPASNQAPLINFLLADSYFDAQNYNQALKEYEKTAYQYSNHSKSAEAGYAALITYDKVINNAEENLKPLLKQQSIQSAIRFSNLFPDDKHAPAVITKTAEELFSQNNFIQSAEFARRIISRKDIQDRALQKTAWIVLAHSQFELRNYKDSEISYTESLKYTSKKDKLYTELSDRLAASIYKQGEQQRNAGQYNLAAFNFLRIAKVVPASTIRITAEYDAATMYIKVKDWNNAGKILEDFRKRYPKNNKYSQGVSEKLALIYTDSGQFNKAAKEIALLASVSSNKSDQQKLTWQAAEMYTKAGQKKQANAMYEQYIFKYPKPFSQYMEAHSLVSKYYKDTKQLKSWKKWLNATVTAEKQGGSNRTDRTNLIAANAVLHLTRPLTQKYTKARLTIPLKKSLARKKALMERSLKSYAKVMSYGIAEITTEATYQIAEIYHHFATALMESQRPRGLSADELEQYDILIEEQAYPFEEKSIDIHNSNTRRTKDGFYDQWIKKSLDILAKFEPVRYLKKEKTQSYVLLSNE